MIHGGHWREIFDARVKDIRGRMRLWLGRVPFVALPALPLILLAFRKGVSPAVMALSAGASLLIFAYLSAARRRGVQQGKALSRALEDAERHRQRAEDASAVKSEFLALMSHEIRTPLNGVLGMAMAADRLAQTQKERLQVLRQSGESLLVLLNDLLDLSEIAAGKLRLQSGIVQPEGLAAETEARFGPLAAAKGIGLSVCVAEDGRAPRGGDPARVRQVLHQLVDNAVKFTDAGQVAITIRGSAEALVLEVADTGQGIEAERLSTIFERFSQADGSTTRRHGGSGVGLTLSHGLALLMGGDITAESVPGQGSTFTAHLALAPAAVEDVAAEPGAASEAEGPEPLRVRILAAEDNATNRMVLQTLLETVGLSAHMVENGQEAVDAWRAAHWDLILMDIQMPVMDGVTATRTIRQIEREEGRPRTPIVALTANAMSHQAAEYVAAGMDGLVPKPIEFGKLIQVIANAGEAPDEEAIRAA